LSRIGKLPIAIPSGVKVAVDTGSVHVEGPRGKLQTAIPAGVKVRVDGNLVRVERESDERKFRALHGLTRKLIAKVPLKLPISLGPVLSAYDGLCDALTVSYRDKAKPDEWIVARIYF